MGLEFMVLRGLISGHRTWIGSGVMGLENAEAQSLNLSGASLQCFSK